MDRRVTPPKRVTSPTWGPPPPCKQALSEKLLICKQFFYSGMQIKFIFTRKILKSLFLKVRAFGVRNDLNLHSLREVLLRDISEIT